MVKIVSQFSEELQNRSENLDCELGDKIVHQLAFKTDDPSAHSCKNCLKKLKKRLPKIAAKFGRKDTQGNELELGIWR